MIVNLLRGTMKRHRHKVRLMPPQILCSSLLGLQPRQARASTRVGVGRWQAPTYQFPQSIRGHTLRPVPRRYWHSEFHNGQKFLSIGNACLIKDLGRTETLLESSTQTPHRVRWVPCPSFLTCGSRKCEARLSTLMLPWWLGWH